jgi:hypothetical protein
MGGGRGHFSLEFTYTGELNRFCAMRLAQKYELLLKAKTLAQALAREKVRLMQLSETYAVKGSTSEYHFDLRNSISVTFNSGTGVISGDQYISLGYNCHNSPKTMRKAMKVIKASDYTAPSWYAAPEIRRGHDGYPDELIDQDAGSTFFISKLY